MLQEVRIRGLGVIDDAVLELGPGLTVVTGETGAGKTMVVTGLGLLLGERADPAAVRTGQTSALVEGRFVVDAASGVAARAGEAGAELEDDGAGRRELLVARSVAAAGRSRAHVGGRAVPVSLLTELADDLVAVHGQSEQLLLRSPSRQRDVVDAVAGDAVAVPLAAYRQAWARWQEVRAEITALESRTRERAQEAERLTAALTEVERVDPRPGEDDALAAEAARLDHSEDLRTAAAGAHADLVGDAAAAEPLPDATGLLVAARRRLEVVGEHDGDLAALAGRLAEAGYVVTDVAAELSGYLASLEADPARLGAVQDRRAELSALVRRVEALAPDATHHGADGADGADGSLGHGPLARVVAWSGRAATRVAELDDEPARAQALATEAGALTDRLDGLAADLHRARADAAARLSADATAELAGLAMPDAALVVEVEERDELGPAGRDEVAMLLRAHAGAPPRPLGRGASGGELSRVMLALEVVLAGGDPVPTFVFDEVDAGVGGRAAVEVGRRLAALGHRAQVVVVTHLPQVAAFADRHLVVTKAAHGHVTASDVHSLDDAARVVELARMLAGQEESGSARAHATELLELAASARPAPPRPPTRGVPRRAPRRRRARP